jgi:hypothetical protein
MTKKEARTANSTSKKLAVQWLNQALCFVSSSVLVDSFVLRNPPERQAEKRHLNFDKIVPQKSSNNPAEK